MNNHQVLCLTLLLFSTGCITPEEPDTTNKIWDAAVPIGPLAPQATASETSYNEYTQEIITTHQSNAYAHQLESDGCYEDAMKEYAGLQAAASNANDEMKARLGRARCMLRLNQPDGAIALLSDVPEEPSTPIEAQQMALMGEAFLRKGHPQYAESLLEIALDFPDAEYERWAPPAFANLASAYVLCDKPEKAYSVYKYAAHLFRLRRRYEDSTACRAAAAQLRRTAESELDHRSTKPIRRIKI